MKQRNHLTIHAIDADHYLDEAERRALNDILAKARRKRGKIANTIVEELFRGSKGMPVGRLVQALPNGEDGCSWGRGAVRDLILRHLEDG